MARIKGIRSSAALIVAVLALITALGGGAVAGVTISKLNKKEKKQVKRISKRISKKQARKLDRRIKLLPGPTGPKGDAGADATNFFAYIRDTASDTYSTDEATIAYGEGVSAVEDPDNSFTYTLSFDRDLTGCVVQANAGTGRPRGTASSYLATVSHVSLENPGLATNQARVSFYKPDFTSSYDTSFMVTAFC
jgi:hypothetical protein